MKLEEANLKALAFADDLVFTADGQIELYRGLNVIQEWSNSHKVKVNKDKSGIMCVRVDKRTPQPNFTNVRGIAIMTEYKYLGIMIDDTL